MKYLATSAAWKLVPQATMRTASVLANTAWAAGPNAASSSLPPATRSSSVCATARGCSWISLSM